jgi:Zn-dependent membrane protease YugP
MFFRADLLLIPALLLAIWAQWQLLRTYRRWSAQRTARGVTGAQAARQFLDAAGLQVMPVERFGGFLTDHYDPHKLRLRLSEEVYNGDSLAAVGIAAHEAGHALQHKEAYGPMQIRMAMVPITQLGSWLALPLFALGLVMRIPPLMRVGIILFLALLLFQLITLPVEFDASRRARKLLSEHGIITSEELDGVSDVLSAAAWTYIAAFTMSFLQLARLLMLQRR